MMIEELNSSISLYEEAFQELNQRLLHTTLELESLKKEAGEQIQRQKKYTLHLLKLLGLAYQQRDDAKDRLRSLLYVLASSSQPNPIPPLTYSRSPLLMTTNANSSITESNTVSGTYNGPLLQTVMAAGPASRLSNAPPMHPFEIPPVTIPSFQSANQNPNVAAAADDTNYAGQEPISPATTFNMPLQICCASMLSDVSSPSSGQNDGLLSSVTGIPTTKRQRFH